MLRFAFIALVSLLLSGAALAQDVFLKNANGYTFQGDELVRFDALLVKDSKVQAVGSSQILEPYASPGTVRDIAGKTVLPGLSNIHTALTYRAEDYCAANPKKTIADCLLAVLNNEAKRGITLVQDTATNENTWFALRALEDQNRLPVRVYTSIDAHSASYEPLLEAGAYAGTYKHMLALRSISWRRSHPVHSCLPSNIAKAPNFNRTYKKLDPIAMRNWIARGVMRGYQLRIGSAGEAEAGNVLKAFEDVIQIAGTNGRHVFAPLRRPKGDAVERLDAANITLGIAPCLDPLLKGRTAPSILQKLKKDKAFFQDAAAQGLPLTLAQGYPVPTMTALAGGSDSTMEAALKAYTLGGAYAAFWDAYTGSLEAGKWADFVVLERDIFDAAPSKTANAPRVLETWVAGKRIYKR